MKELSVAKNCLRQNCLCIKLIYYKFHKVNFRCGGSCIHSAEWMKRKKTTTNSKTDDDKCFQYVVMAALNYVEIESHAKRVSNIKPLLNKYN